MMKRMMLCAMFAVALAGCSSSGRVAGGEEAASLEGDNQTFEAKEQFADGTTEVGINQRYLFDYDRDMIKQHYLASLEAQAKYLQEHQNARIRLEGHTDDRGSHEYNLALGERRARSVLRALKGYGAEASQIDMVSYGKERPLCLDQDESCWSKNRRVDLIYTSK